MHIKSACTPTFGSSLGRLLRLTAHHSGRPLRQYQYQTHLPCR